MKIHGDDYLVPEQMYGTREAQTAAQYYDSQATNQRLSSNNIGIAKDDEGGSCNLDMREDMVEDYHFERSTRSKPISKNKTGDFETAAFKATEIYLGEDYQMTP